MASTQTSGAPGAATQTSAITGLDSLELGPVSTGRSPWGLSRKAWAAIWPKLLAICLVLRAWHLVYLSNFPGGSAISLVKDPCPGRPDPGHHLPHTHLRT